MRERETRARTGTGRDLVATAAGTALGQRALSAPIRCERSAARRTAVNELLLAVALAIMPDPSVASEAVAMLEEMKMGRREYMSFEELAKSIGVHV